MFDPKNFFPEYFLKVSSDKELRIKLVIIDSLTYAVGCFYNDFGERLSMITKSIILFNGNGKAHFRKSGEVFYLSDFTKIPHRKEG